MSLAVSGRSKGTWLVLWWFAVAQSGGGGGDVRPVARSGGTKSFSGQLNGSTGEQPLGFRPTRRAR